MQRIPLLILLAALVFSAMQLIAVADEDKEAIAKAKESILAVTKLVAEGKEEAAKKQMAEIAKGSKLESIMWQLKIRRRGGIGFGQKPGLSSFKDGIEAKIRDMSRKPLTARDVKKQAEDIIQMARITQVISQLTLMCTPEEKDKEKDPADWKRWAEEMGSHSKLLQEATKKGDARELQRIARDLNNSCNNCHGVFR